ncbi:C4-type zinc ribbon domain-containing protein [Candidatus Binatia bacterium]|nr:C4-type zinc ribbon domain-containing protein [Candidatus Binatia bacterium]
MEAAENRLAQQRQLAETKRNEREALDKQRREIESVIEADEARMKDRRMRLNRVRNERELQALRYEIEQGKEVNRTREEELLALLEAGEVAAATADEATRVLAEIESGAQTQTAEYRQRIRELEAAIAGSMAERERMVAGLETRLLRRYEQIFARRGGMAVVEVRNGICQGCFMNLPPQFFNELQRANDVRTCPNCHRILCWRPE